jgi:hypothetical protein
MLYGASRRLRIGLELFDTPLGALFGIGDRLDTPINPVDSETNS